MYVCMYLLSFSSIFPTFSIFCFRLYRILGSAVSFWVASKANHQPKLIFVHCTRLEQHFWLYFFRGIFPLFVEICWYYYYWKLHMVSEIPIPSWDQGGHTHQRGRTTGHEPWWGQLPTEPCIRPLSWHGVFPLCQEPEEMSTSFFWWRPLIEIETSSFR